MLNLIEIQKLRNKNKRKKDLIIYAIFDLVSTQAHQAIDAHLSNVLVLNSTCNWLDQWKSGGLEIEGTHLFVTHLINSTGL